MTTLAWILGLWALSLALIVLRLATRRHPNIAARGSESARFAPVARATAPEARCPQLAARRAAVSPLRPGPRAAMPLDELLDQEA